MPNRVAQMPLGKRRPVARPVASPPALQMTPGQLPGRRWSYHCLPRRPLPHAEQDRRLVCRPCVVQRAVKPLLAVTCEMPGGIAPAATPTDHPLEDFERGKTRLGLGGSHGN